MELKRPSPPQARHQSLRTTRSVIKSRRVRVALAMSGLACRDWSGDVLSGAEDCAAVNLGLRAWRTRAAGPAPKAVHQPL